jgi:5-formyltetrahydrofolate cyclo-ligase
MSALPPKEFIRKQAADRRAVLKPQIAELSLALAQQFLAQVPVAQDAVVSSYWAIGDEADPQFLESELRRRGHRIVMPRVAGRNQPLDFHMWEAGSKLVRGGFGLSEPSRDWLKLNPDVLIVPMLAFDGAGYRVGYGAGYYDRTIRALRAVKSIIAVGFAFAVQEFSELPHLAHDERLDWIVTENGTRRIS